MYTAYSWNMDKITDYHYNNPAINKQITPFH